MQVDIASETSVPVIQTLSREWYGTEIHPPVCFSFILRGSFLRFMVWRQAAARVHPEGRPGLFMKNLWHYDTAEFFLSDVGKTRYLEFNLSPCGAWWGCVFLAPREPDPHVGIPEGVLATGACNGGDWRCQADIPLEWLRAAGLEVHCCRLAAAAILGSPNYLYLTSAEPTTGKPDFHLPGTWPLARLL